MQYIQMAHAAYQMISGKGGAPGMGGAGGHAWHASYSAHAHPIPDELTFSLFAAGKVGAHVT
jgi:hypothetical protein